MALFETPLGGPHILRDDFSNQYLSFYAKKLGVKILANFPDCVPLTGKLLNPTRNYETFFNNFKTVLSCFMKLLKFS